MKSFNISLFISAIFLFISISCQKSEIIPDDLEPQAHMLKGGKPGGSSAYDLSDDITPMQIYGVWHAGSEYCTWGSVRDMAEFDLKNHWIIDRGDGNPSVNLVVLSFVNPLKLLNQTTDATTLNGIPRGMTSAVVSYFKSKGIRVMLSIGGITYTNDWNAALAKNAYQLGLNAAAVAATLGVGIEIDYEESSNPNLAGLQSFIDAYRSVHSYDATGSNPAARLTIDLAAGDRWLIGICQKATTDWLKTGENDRVLDYANAMVPARQPSATAATDSWYEHVVGKLQYAPPIPPLAPCKFTGALYISGSVSTPECVDFNSSIQKTNSHFVRSVKSKITGTSSGMLGYMFWAAECPSTRQACAVNCYNGLGVGAKEFNIPVPMPALRQN
jgi:hypothetical protein